LPLLVRLGGTAGEARKCNRPGATPGGVDRNMNTTTTTTLPPHNPRRHRARRLLRLERERLAVERQLEAACCAFRGRVERRHRALSHALDAIHAETFAAWEAA
jgi:hypothetical protein